VDPKLPLLDEPSEGASRKELLQDQTTLQRYLAV